MPASIAAFTTGGTSSSAIRAPKLLQPMPTAETVSPDGAELGVGHVLRHDDLPLIGRLLSGRGLRRRLGRPGAAARSAGRTGLRG